MECEDNAQFKCWQCSGPLCDTHARRAGNAGMVYCNITHAPTEDEVATYERAIGVGEAVAAMAGSAVVAQPLAPPNVEGGQALEGVQPRGDEEEEHVNVLT